MEVHRRSDGVFVGASALAAAAVVAVVWGTAGHRAGAAAAVGLAMVTLFFLSGRIPLRLPAASAQGAGFMLLGLGYIMRILLLLAVFRALADAEWVDRHVLGGVVIGASLVWMAGQVYRHVTSRRPTLEIDLPHGPAEDRAINPQGEGR